MDASPLIFQDILNSIEQFSDFERELFQKHTVFRSLVKNDILLAEGQVCKSLYFIRFGSFYQFQMKEIAEIVIDLHLQNEWMYNHQSLVSQTPSTTTIKAFTNAEIIELSLENFHLLSSKSPSFLQFGRLLNPTLNRTHIFDNSLSPVEKYEYIKKAKPNLVKEFPVNMIASYLKIAPETLSRVRAKF